MERRLFAWYAAVFRALPYCCWKAPTAWELNAPVESKWDDLAFAPTLLAEAPNELLICRAAWSPTYWDSETRWPVAWSTESRFKGRNRR